MPRLVRLYIQSVAVGFGLAAGFVALMIWQDLAGIGHLILGSSAGMIAAAMLFVFFGILFAGVQFGLRVMLMAQDDDTPRGGLRQHAQPMPVRAAAPVPARRRR